MKKSLYTLIFIFLAFGSLNAQELDSLSRKSLSDKIDRYFGALASESLAVQQSEADFMIELSSDSLVRQFTARKIYDHFMESPAMGAENVAVYLFDKWFRSGKLKMDSEIDYLNANIYAEFNRQSLIGCRAPELKMESIDASVQSLFGSSDAMGKYRVLFFYDTDCPKCKLESILLRNMFITESFPVEFYAIYTGDDRDAWNIYVNDRFSVVSDAHHLWDPQLESDFQRKYGVLQTPRLFLTDPSGYIVGRGLDTKALGYMLHQIFDEKKLEYGGKESMDLFDQIFSGDADPGLDDVKEIADYIESSTMSGADTTMFRQLTGDMLYYLSVKTGEGFKEGADYLIDNKILNRPEIWKTADDSLKVIGLAQFMNALLDKAKPGNRVADMKVPSERIIGSGSKIGRFHLRKIGGHRNVILFYTEGCANCDAEKAAARQAALADRNLRILMVNVDELLSTSPSLASELFESFDLSTLPFILETDRKGTIIRRYITLL